MQILASQGCTRMLARRVPAPGVTHVNGRNKNRRKSSRFSYKPQIGPNVILRNRVLARHTLRSCDSGLLFLSSRSWPLAFGRPMPDLQLRLPFCICFLFIVGRRFPLCSSPGPQRRAFNGFYGVSSSGSIDSLFLFFGSQAQTIPRRTQPRHCHDPGAVRGAGSRLVAPRQRG